MRRSIQIGSSNEGFELKKLSQMRTGKSALRKRRSVLLEAGFTLIELMIVITIILILIGIAAGRYEKSVVRAREATLKQDLQAMRQSIDNYTLDKQAAPQSLEDLVQAGYLPKDPVDPITGAADWGPQFDRGVLRPDQPAAGRVDGHSNCPPRSPFGNHPSHAW